MAEADKLPLVEIIQALSRELREAERIAREKIATASNDAPVLQLRDCSIELGITWELEADAGVSFYVFKLGGHANKSNTQTITLNMVPIGGEQLGAEALVLPLPILPAADQ
jgi:hypothetical protein